MTTGSPRRVNVLLDPEHAAKLQRLAQRTHTNPGTVARSLLANAIDEADPDARTITDILDRIDGAYDDAQRGLEEGLRGLGTPLEDL